MEKLPTAEPVLVVTSVFEKMAPSWQDKLVPARTPFLHSIGNLGTVLPTGPSIPHKQLVHL